MSTKEDLIALTDAAQQLGWPLTPQQAQDLLRYRDLIVKWNSVYNLTAVRDSAQMLTHHIIDSLATVPALSRQIQNNLRGNTPLRLLDVGSGGGLPGVVFAALLPQIEVTCIDAVGKKSAFVQQVAAELGLRNLHAIHRRVEQLRGPPFDIICSRAFAALDDFVRLSRAHLRLANKETGVQNGLWMALKGKIPEQEIAALPADIGVFHVEPIHIPQLQAQRCIVWMGLGNATQTPFPCVAQGITYHPVSR